MSRMLAMCIILTLLQSDQAAAQAGSPPLPIIDMHLHASELAEFGGGGPACVNRGRIVLGGWDPQKPLTPDVLGTCEVMLPGPTTDEALLRETVAVLDRLNIWAVTSGPRDRLAAWRRASSRFIASLDFTSTSISPDEYRRLHAAGEFRAFGELLAQYRGLSPADSIYDAYFALAEELDIPVGVHLGEGPPGGAHTMSGGSTPTPYRVRLGSPLELEAVLIRHPRLRIYAMHFGSPFVDEMIAMLFSHPQLYVDIAQNNWGFPRAHFYSQLERLINAGFEQRIMFGSDQMVWPQTIEVAIETVTSAPFLSESQKRDILYHNAARFLRLDAAEIARHHGR